MIPCRRVVVIVVYLMRASPFFLSLILFVLVDSECSAASVVAEPVQLIRAAAAYYRC